MKKMIALLVLAFFGMTATCEMTLYRHMKSIYRH